MPSHLGATCDLYIGGSKAPEYDVTIENNTCTAWVMAEEDKEYGFEIDLSKTGAEQHKLHFHADGQVLIRRATDKKTISEYHAAATRRDESVMRTLLENDTEATEVRKDVIEGVGSLKWTLWRIKDMRSRKPSQKTRHCIDTVGSLQEKMIKAASVSHCTQLGKSVTMMMDSCDYDFIDPWHSPYVIFIFRYASKAILQSKGLIPRTPSPEIIDNDVLSMTQLDLQREVMRLRDEAKIKQEIKEEPREETLPTVVEQGPPRKKAKIVIDLCNDD
ncbi:hypothetical protein ABW21_db0200801 [Orbilia brochopaga]|nr:hypothetical protein ABW21_db0200801 [Drechslerella brochopaga]